MKIDHFSPPRASMSGGIPAGPPPAANGGAAEADGQRERPIGARRQREKEEPPPFLRIWRAEEAQRRFQKDGLRGPKERAGLLLLPATASAGRLEQMHRVQTKRESWEHIYWSF